MIDDLTLTKNEVSKAYQFLYKVVIPNYFKSKYLKNISIEGLYKSLKVKKRTNNMIQLSSSEIEDDEFIILKTSEGIDVGFFTPHGNKPFLFPVYYHLNESANDDKKRKTPNDYSIDKFEENYAFIFLNKVVIPKAVQRFNSQVVKEKPSWENNFKPRTPVNIVDVIRNLKKYGHYREEGDKDLISYKSKLPNITFKFYIEKMLDQRPDKIWSPDRNIVLSVRYSDPFLLQDVVFQVGEKYL